MQILQAEISTSNINPQRKFYRNLGFDCGPYADGIGVQIGWSLLLMIPSELNADQPTHFTFNLAPNRFEAALAWGKQHLDLLPHNDDVVITFDAPWHARSFYFYDAGGNIVEIIARDRIAISEATGDFHPAELLCISEIALVGDPASDVAGWLKASGLPLFTGDERDNFSAWGDDDGLVLVSTIGRNWLPTATPAGIYPVAITTTHDSPAIRLLQGYPYQLRQQVLD